MPRLSGQPCQTDFDGDTDSDTDSDYSNHEMLGKRVLQKNNKLALQMTHGLVRIRIFSRQAAKIAKE